ncbi:hypothetical protein BGX27_010444 [Mortierella sp. AM989]|nr:hypothetical protein BGX27_010444 [Mortierella sp. AM989]
MVSSSDQVFPSPPSYEEAIGRPLQNTPSAPPLITSGSGHGLTPQDFDSSSLFQDGADDRDMEEERDYEESRPLKMGRIPDARAQYTFIQPNDTIDVNNSNSNNSHHTFPVLHNSSHLPDYNPNSSAVQQSQQYFSSPTSPINPAYNAPSAPSSAPVEYQQQQGEQSKPDKSNVQPIQPSSSNGSTSYAPPPFPPPSMAAAPVPLAGIPDTPGLINAQDISIAGYKRTKKGAESCDKVLEDPYQLYRFFVAHNDRPTMHALIRGHHTEKCDSIETDSAGNRKVVSRSLHVEDFKMDFDLTPYISPRGTLYTAPDPKTGKNFTIREVMEQYAEEENQFKEIHMVKNVVWDYEDLTRAITHAIRSVHYRYTIDISFPCTNNVVIVRSSSPLANFMRNGWTKALCFVSVVGVIFYPAREIYKKVKDKTLKSEFQMTISTRDFYNLNYWSIVDQVQYK